MEKRGVAINPIAQWHWMDHLAVVSIMMGIPLLLMDAAEYALAKKYYPHLDARLLEFQELTPEYLVSNYDVLFLSNLSDKLTFHEKYRLLEAKYNKTLRHVHCPHGFSDKGFYLKKCAYEDILLVYGQNMLDLLKHQQVLAELKNYVVCGNYRYTYFLQHRPFFDELIAREVLARFPKKQPIIIYAPTWVDVEESSTFFEAYAHILEKLPDNYNMIVKIHPRLEHDDVAQYYHIVGKYESKPNVLFLNNFPLVYPLLAHSDIYLGDTSSVGYDFLPFNKPMFFLNKRRGNPKTERDLFLFRCGVDIKPEAYPLIYQIIEANLASDAARFGALRAELYTYTFGVEKSFAAIKADIIAAYNKPL